MKDLSDLYFYKGKYRTDEGLKRALIKEGIVWMSPKRNYYNYEDVFHCEAIEKVADDMETSIGHLPDTAKFDFIVSSKFIQELRHENAYNGISALCQARLKNDGIMCMLETYREGRTESNSFCASKAENCQVVTLSKVEFSVMQIPGCSCVNEVVGFQLFIKQT